MLPLRISDGRGMGLFFHLYPTNHPLGNRESRNLNWTPNFAEKRGVSTTKNLFFAWNRKDEHEMRPFLYLYHKSISLDNGKY